MNFIYKHLNKIIIISILIPFFSVGLGNDEPFTMGLINHGYSEIWNLTSLDIHPPFYYWILKLFLSIFTFWTSDIFIKIILSRLLSFLFFFITFIYLIKILRILNIKKNCYTEFLILLVMPTSLNLIPVVTNIRMYSLVAMMFSMIMYYSFMFHKRNNNIYLLYIYILLTTLLYTNYVAAFIGGLYLILNIINYAINKRYRQSIYLILIGFISVISFYPWIYHMVDQLSYKQSPASVSLILKFVIEVIFSFVIFFIPYLFKKNLTPSEKKLFFIFPTIIIIVLFFISLVRIKTGGGIISLRYLSPVLIPYSFLSVNILINYLKSNKNMYSQLTALMMILYCLFGMSISMYKQINRYFIPQFSFIEKFNTLKNDKSSEISVSQSHLNKYFWDKGDGGGGNAIYLLSINKKISDKNYINTSIPIGNGNVKLFKAVFPNIEHYSTNKKY